MTQEQIARAKEPIKYFMPHGSIQTGHLPSTKRTVFIRLNDSLYCYCLFSPNKRIAIFRVTKWK